MRKYFVILAIAILIVSPIVLVTFLFSSDFENKDKQLEEETIAERIDVLISSSPVSKVSVYFEPIQSGEIVVINRYEKYTPASLFKVGVMMTYFRIAQVQPAIMDYELKFEDKRGDLNRTQFIKPSQNLEIDKSYSVRELIVRMIKYSDNNATDVLLESGLFDPRIFSQTYIDLEIPFSDEGEDFIRVSEYSKLLRALVDHSFLNEEWSNKAIEIMVQSEFTAGLVAGTDPETRVAHKFGTNETRPGEMQIHDCGIVFHPKNPYILCVMTKSSDYNIGIDLIKKISSEVFEEINK